MDVATASIISSIVQAICAAASLVVLIVYTRYTKGLLDETRAMRLAQTDPHICAYIERRTNGMFALIIENDGSGPAVNINVSADVDPEVIEGYRLSEQEPFSQPIRYLPAKARESHTLTMLSLPEEPVTLTFRYESVTKRKFEGQFTLPLKELSRNTGIALAHTINRIRAGRMR